MSGWKFLQLLIISSTVSLCFCADQCIWYGQCGHDPLHPSMIINCLSSQPAPLLTDATAQKTLATLCPQYAGNATHPPRTCCSPKQISTMSTNMDLPKQLLARCPSCYQNFVDLYCAFTCDPEHSRFLVPTKNVTTDTGEQGVSEVLYGVSKNFTDALFTSCQDVIMPSNNQKALGVLCGRDASQCTPKLWLSFMGDMAQNPKVPFQINFNLTDEPFNVKDYNHTEVEVTPMYMETSPCESSCSCQDCRGACSAPEPTPAPPAPCLILNVDCYIFVAICVFLVFLVVFGISQLWILIFCAADTSSTETNSLRPPYVTSNGESLDYANLILPDEIGCCSKIGANMELKLERLFERWGYFCASHPALVLGIGLLVVTTLASGLVMFTVITDPVELWSAPDSRARTEKNYFDDNFTPFFRTEQLIITPTNMSRWYHTNNGQSEGGQWFGPVLQKDFLHEVLALQRQLMDVTVWYDAENRTLSMEDICFQPLSPENTDCTIMSVLNYWQNNATKLDEEIWDEYHFFKQADYIDHFSYCVRDPAAIFDTTALHMPCLGAFGGPVAPWVALGGFPEDNYENATALVITFSMNNFKDEAFQSRAEAWEQGFLDIVKNFSSPNMTVAYSAQRSIQDELNRESRSDVLTIVLSYLVMFVYVSLALGEYKGCSITRWLIDAKVLLGLSGVLIVFMSVLSSLGFFSYMKVPATLIIIEVIPFLVLAVGVDNIFILVQKYQRSERAEGVTIEEQVAYVVGKVGPSMMLTSLSESLAFFLGALTTMPAVRIFSLYAAQAVLFDFFLQITCFISLLTLDAKRQQSHRLECCCCARVSQPLESGKHEGIVYWIFKYIYTEILLHPYVRPVVMIIFVGNTCLSAAIIPRLDIGLDQRLSMPSDSYVLDYFNNMSEYLNVGPPVYFVVEGGHNYTTLDGQNQICGGKGCPEDAVLGQIFKASQISNYSRVAHPASSWLDDYFDWVAPGGNPPCCRRTTDTHEFCPATAPNGSHCEACPVEEVDGRPVSHDFMTYLPWFLEDNPSQLCAKGGHAAYSSGVNLLDNQTSVGATYFMTYHTILKTSDDYVAALRFARELADNITHTIEHWGENSSDVDGPGMSSDWSKATEKVFPYSVFYVFYEQYLTVAWDAVFNLSVSIAAIFVVTFILMGFDLWSSLIVVLLITFILTHMVGLMVMWNISLNAVSLVNLVMTVGISVEFCSHIIRAFAVSTQSTRIARAKDALANTGSSVLSGITLTKLGGIIVLAFSKSQLFEVFYFRMYLGIVIFGATNGLIFLPVLLSYIGPPLNKARLYNKQQEVARMFSASAKKNINDADAEHGDYDDNSGLVDNMHGESYNPDYQPSSQQTSLGSPGRIRTVAPPTFDQLYPPRQYAVPAASGTS